MSLRPYHPDADSSSEQAERIAADVRNLLNRLDKGRISVGKLVSGETGHASLARDIEITTSRDKPEDGMLMTISLRSQGDGSDPKPLAYYQEYRHFVEALQHEGSVMQFGRRSTLPAADSDDRPIVEFTLTHAGSERLADKVRSLDRKLTYLLEKKDAFRDIRRS